ncbi:MAG: HAMP domain-containing sensor histidine kinase [Tissierellia bacterium]|nr:HAMP domain-containing sensor histidine kinase [Tissierellia bacterium]
MLRSKEMKAVLICFIILFLLNLITTFVIVEYNLNSISKSLSKQNIAVVGAILSENPELEDTIVPIVTKEIGDREFELGRNVLDKYNYNELVGHRNQIAIINGAPDFWYQIVISISSYFLIGVSVFLYKSRQIGKKIERLYLASEKVINGDFRVRLTEDGEGPISILNHQFNKMSTIIKKNYENLNREKLFLKDTISDISHQLKTPLASIAMFNELMLDDEDMDIETRREFLEKSKLQYERMEWLIINLLKIARIEAGAIKFKKDRVNMMDVVKESIKAVEARLIKCSQKVVIDSHDDVSFIGDFEWTEEAISNIIKNATEYAPEGSDIIVNIRKSATISMVSVKNSGPHIDAKDINYIFRRFYRSGSRKDSVGIGLNLTKSIIEGQGGIISARNVTDGVEFTISFMNPENINTVARSILDKEEIKI